MTAKMPALPLTKGSGAPPGPACFKSPSLQEAEITLSFWWVLAFLLVLAVLLAPSFQGAGMTRSLWSMLRHKEGSGSGATSHFLQKGEGSGKWVNPP